MTLPLVAAPAVVVVVAVVVATAATVVVVVVAATVVAVVVAAAAAAEFEFAERSVAVAPAAEANEEESAPAAAASVPAAEGLAPVMEATPGAGSGVGVVDVADELDADAAGVETDVPDVADLEVAAEAVRDECPEEDAVDVPILVSICEQRGVVVGAVAAAD